MHGLKEAGKLFNLVSLLQSFDFNQNLTPSLFRHVSRPTTFVLVVDDFGVQYYHPSDFAFLVYCFSTLYHVKAHPITTKFLGFSLDHNRSHRTITVSYPGYIPTLLMRLCPAFVTHTFSPFIYAPPVYGSRELQSHISLDTSLSHRPLPSEGPAGSRRLPPVLRSRRRRPFPGRHLCPRLGTSLAHVRHHDPPQSPPRLRCLPPQWTQNLPSVGDDPTHTLGRLIPFPTPSRQCVSPEATISSATTATTPHSTTPSPPTPHVPQSYAPSSQKLSTLGSSPPDASPPTNVKYWRTWVILNPRHQIL
jgi:hypothetical protein